MPNSTASSPVASSPGEVPVFDALILAGGAGSRLGGQDKAALVVAGQPLLSRVLRAVADARRVVVVGPVEVPDGVVQVTEDPPGGGPVAGVAAGLAELTFPGAAGRSIADASIGGASHEGRSDEGRSNEGASTAGRPMPGASNGDAPSAGSSASDPAQPAPWVCVLAVDQPAATDALAPILSSLAQVGPEVDAVCHQDAGGHPQWLLAAYRPSALQRAMAPHGSGHGIAMRRLVESLRLHFVSAGAEHVGDVDTWTDHARWEDRLGWH